MNIKMVGKAIAKRIMSVAVAVTMVIASTSVSTEAAKKVTLTPKNVSLKEGKSKKLTLKNNMKKVIWTIVSGKKYVSLKNKQKKKRDDRGQEGGQG